MWIYSFMRKQLSNTHTYFILSGKISFALDSLQKLWRIFQTICIFYFMKKQLSKQVNILDSLEIFHLTWKSSRTSGKISRQYDFFQTAFKHMLIFYIVWRNFICSGKVSWNSGNFSKQYEFILSRKTAFKHMLISYIVWKNFFWPGKVSQTSGKLFRKYIFFFSHENKLSNTRYYFR